MIFTHIIPALLVAAVAAQAFYIPDALYAHEFEEFSELSEHGFDHLNVVHDLATQANNEVTVLTATDIAALGIGSESEDVLSHILVTCMESPLPGPYECKSKADCQKHIDYTDKQILKVIPVVARWKAALEAAPKGSTAYRTTKNNLHTAEESLEGWKENKVDYKRLKAHFPS